MVVVVVGVVVVVVGVKVQSAEGDGKTAGSGLISTAVVNPCGEFILLDRTHDLEG